MVKNKEIMYKGQRIAVWAAVLCTLLAGTPALADETNKPALQIADNTFFDPTKKQAEEAYRFGVEYRLEIGYAQHEQRTHELTYPQLFLHGIRVGATFQFLLPMHFSMQTGLLYTMTYGQNEQHWRSTTMQAVQAEVLRHKVLEHNLTIPVRAYYTIPLWKKLNLFFYTGPQLQIGLAEQDNIDAQVSETKPNDRISTKEWLEAQGIPTESYDRMKEDRLRTNIQWGLGGGLEWDRYRLQSGYDFGLNNLARKVEGQPNRYMSEWGWFISVSFRL